MGGERSEPCYAGRMKRVDEKLTAKRARMVCRATVLLTLAICACSPPVQVSEKQIRAAQAKSVLGQTDTWIRVKQLPPDTVQKMRDRAYRFCFAERPNDDQCLIDQDASIFAVLESIRLVPILQSEKSAEFPYARAYQTNPNAFSQVWNYCWRSYSDNGRNDARLLGPCVMAGVGGDFHGIVPVVD